MIETIHHTTKEEWLNARLQDVTSSEVAALFNLSPYITEFELWHHKKNKTSQIIADNDRMKWGDRLEPAIARGIAADKLWAVSPMKYYLRDKTIKMGSSFDFRISEDNGSPCFGILEIKNVDYIQLKQKWIFEDNKCVEAPPHIELQCQHQLAVSGADFLYIGALVGGNNVVTIKRTPDENIITQIKAKVINFWHSIKENKPPVMDFERDAAFISQLYGHAEPGKTMDGNSEIEKLVNLYADISQKEKEITAEKKKIKSHLLTLIDDAEKVIGNDYTISATMVGPAQVSYERKGYRNFKIYKKKGKNE